MNKITPFENKVWLSSPTMHGPELEYVTEAYETNWMSTVGKNINEAERLACEKSRLWLCCGSLGWNSRITYGSKTGRSQTWRESLLFGYDV